MTDQERAHAIVEAFRADGHPYYDELLEPIEAAFAAVRLDERERLLHRLAKSVIQAQPPHDWAEQKGWS